MSRAKDFADTKRGQWLHGTIRKLPHLTFYFGTWIEKKNVPEHQAYWALYRRVHFGRGLTPNMTKGDYCQIVTNKSGGSIGRRLERPYEVHVRSITEFRDMAITVLPGEASMGLEMLLLSASDETVWRYIDKLYDHLHPDIVAEYGPCQNLSPA